MCIFCPKPRVLSLHFDVSAASMACQVVRQATCVQITSGSFCPFLRSQQSFINRFTTYSSKAKEACGSDWKSPLVAGHCGLQTCFAETETSSLFTSDLTFFQTSDKNFVEIERKTQLDTGRKPESRVGLVSQLLVAPDLKGRVPISIRRKAKRFHYD